MHNQMHEQTHYDYLRENSVLKNKLAHTYRWVLLVKAAGIDRSLRHLSHTSLHHPCGQESTNVKALLLIHTPSG